MQGPVQGKGDTEHHDTGITGGDEDFRNAERRRLLFPERRGHQDESFKAHANQNHKGNQNHGHPFRLDPPAEQHDKGQTQISLKALPRKWVPRVSAFTRRITYRVSTGRLPYQIDKKLRVKEVARKQAEGQHEFSHVVKMAGRQ